MKDAHTPMPSLREAALRALLVCDPEAKLAAVRSLSPAMPTGAASSLCEAEGLPGRPARPARVAPARLKARSPRTREGRAALFHALAHIEFNAINLALDAVWRYAGMPEDFYRQWTHVAHEEASHFALLRAHLRGLGHDYGDFPAHDGLWDVAERTRGDPLARLALVPRTLEARGLDASPASRDKLSEAGDAEGAAILETILRDEIGHVAIGNRWYRWVCAQRGLDPERTAVELAERYRAPAPRGPFNLSARRAAGFTEAELARLAGAAR